MRLWALCPSALYAALGYFLYGWGAQAGAHWLTVAFGVGAMIAQQVSACAVATAYAMDCFPGVSVPDLAFWRKGRADVEADFGGIGGGVGGVFVVR